MREVDRTYDGAAALHDIEAEAGDEEGLTDLFVVDLVAARSLGVALDPLDEPTLA